MGEPATVPDMIVFVAACTVIGGLILVLAGFAAHAAGWGMAAEAEPAKPVEAPTAKAARPRDDGSFVCLCSHEMRDDGRGEWDSVSVIDVVNEECPIHGPSGYGWDFIEITTTSDEGKRRYIRGGRTARSIPRA